MLEKSFGLLIFLKQPRNYNTGSMHIYLRITVDGISKELSSKRLWEPSRWNPKAAKATGNKEDSKELNAYLDTLRNKVYEARRTLLETNKPVTAAAIKDLLTGTKEMERTVLQVFREHNERMLALVGKEYAPGTMERYRTALEQTKSFIQYSYGKEDIELSSLSYSFISEYAFWLKSIRNCGHNTAMKYLSNFKKIVLHCVRNGWLTTDPFCNYRLGKKEVVRTALSEVELKMIRVKTFASERLNHVRDIFLFSCYTGLAYIDVKQLKRKDVIIGVDGEQWIAIKRQKTDTPTKIPLLPVALDIMMQYAAHPQCEVRGLILPVLSNQKMNAYLKEIADVCGIAKTLTFHIARHTFATTVTLSNGVPIETVSKMLGHKSIKQTQHYAKIVDKKISEDMGALKRKLSEL
jgi:site-specific recombinase XerD